MRILVLILANLIVINPGSAQDCCTLKPNPLSNSGLKISEELNQNVEQVIKVPIVIDEVKYDTNPRATYCKRPTNFINTIVIHHTETPSFSTPQDINDFHLERGTKNDPWYMIGYGYVINSPYYETGKTPKPKITRGRPIDIVGAHAGSDAFVDMDEDQITEWNKSSIVCGNDKLGFKVNPTMVRIKNNKQQIKANVSTVGIAVSGNYVQRSRLNPNGYPWGLPRYPTKNTIDMIARLACHLQKEHKRIEYMTVHKNYTNTDCPGTLERFISQIKKQAEVYGCKFK